MQALSKNLPYIQEESQIRQDLAINSLVKVFCSKFKLDYKEKLLFKRAAFEENENGASAKLVAGLTLGICYNVSCGSRTQVLNSRLRSA